MTSSPSPAATASDTSPSPAPRDRRRFPRFAIEISVVLRRKAGDLRLTTVDVSRHGAFVRMEQPPAVRQLVQVRFHLPELGEIDAMCMVARSLSATSGLELGPRGPGMGVDFFALSKDAKKQWEAFVADLRSRPRPIEPLPPAPTFASVLAPSGVSTSGLVPMGVPLPPGVAELSSPGTPSPPLGIGVHNADDDLAQQTGSVVMLRLPDRAQLRTFVATDVARGGMFLKTLLVREIGEKVDVVLVHPETDDEFRLEGTVVRRLTAGPPEERGLGIFFRALSHEQHQRLLGFIDSGVEVIELGEPITQRQLELEAVVAREPDSADALEQLGSYLLDQENDLGGALTALTRALVLGPSQVSVHASLARAYRRIGDTVKVRAHERVAEALMMFQDTVKSRAGIDADE